MPKKYRITLTSEEQKMRESVLKRGRVSALKQRHTRILLKADEVSSGATDEQIAQAVGVGTATVEWVRKCFVLHGLTVALTRKNPDRTWFL